MSITYEQACSTTALGLFSYYMMVKDNEFPHPHQTHPHLNFPEISFSVVTLLFMTSINFTNPTAFVSTSNTNYSPK